MDEFADPVLVPAGTLETVLYVDDSGSMSGNLSLGKPALPSMADLLQESPTRIVKFGSGKSVIAPREDKWSTALTCLNWDASSGSTYMWKLIEEDMDRGGHAATVQAGPRGNSEGEAAPDSNHRRIRHRLSRRVPRYERDGPHDENALGKGLHIEFHIIVLGDRQQHAHALKQYKSLAEATGGGYLALSGGMYVSEKNPDMKSSVKNLEASNDTAMSRERRTKQRQEYLSEARSGKRRTLIDCGYCHPRRCTDVC
jgi:hypothetical protein